MTSSESSSICIMSSFLGGLIYSSAVRWATSKVQWVKGLMWNACTISGDFFPQIYISVSQGLILSVATVSLEYHWFNVPKFRFRQIWGFNNIKILHDFANFSQLLSKKFTKLDFDRIIRLCRSENFVRLSWQESKRILAGNDSGVCNVFVWWYT